MYVCVCNAVTDRQIEQAVEDGASGGSTVGPRLAALYQKIFEYDGTLAKEEI